MMDLLSLLELSAVILSLAFLSYASWKDWKLREVDDRVWLVFAPLGGFLTLARTVLTGNPSFLQWGLSLAITVVLGLTLYFLGFWGGADAKALTCLALTLPVYPSFLKPLLGFYLTVFPVTILFNTFILSASTVVYVSLRNFAYKLGGGRLFEGFEGEPASKKLLALLVAYKVGREKLPGNPGLSLAEEATAEGGGRRWRFRVGIGEEEENLEVEELPQEVWVTPQLPLLFFLTAGLTVALIFGDLALALTASLFNLFRV